MSSSSDRVLRTRKPGRTALDLLNPPKAATTAKVSGPHDASSFPHLLILNVYCCDKLQPRIRKKSKRVRTQEIETAAHWHPIRLPQELLAHILRFVDSRSTLVVASRVCRSLQDEAERVLYREVTLHRLPQLRSLLQRALKRVRPRAQFIQRLNIDDHGGLAGRAADIKEVLRMLTNLRHLTLHLGALWTKANQYRNVLRILSRCAFSLESFEGDYCPGDNIIAFFRRHQDIVALKIDTPEYVDEHGRADFEFEPHLDDFEVPSTVLPRLRRLYTSPYLARSAFCAPRAVTHLDLGSKPVGEDELHEVLSTFRDLLVKLKYARSPPYIGEAVRSPLRALHLISMPNLEHLDVDDEV